MESQFRRVQRSGDALRGGEHGTTFAVSTRAGYVVLSVVGQLDTSTASALRQQLCDLVDQRHRLVVVDLTEVEFMDSGGLGALIGGLKRARQAGESLHVVATAPQIIQLLQVTGVYKVLPLYDSLTAATAHVTDA